ncbi:hypothetical protein EJ07DRAFT_156126 [Lizonia empirigonia]|nr:hypothetical protein EJ07DRAFT_156126 [Lizonia empirigonia]
MAMTALSATAKILSDAFQKCRASMSAGPSASTSTGPSVSSAPTSAGAAEEEAIPRSQTQAAIENTAQSASASSATGSSIADSNSGRNKRRRRLQDSSTRQSLALVIVAPRGKPHLRSNVLRKDNVRMLSLHMKIDIHNRPEPNEAAQSKIRSIFSKLIPALKSSDVKSFACKTKKLYDAVQQMDEVLTSHGSKKPAVLSEANREIDTALFELLDGATILNIYTQLHENYDWRQVLEVMRLPLNDLRKLRSVAKRSLDDVCSTSTARSKKNRPQQSENQNPVITPAPSAPESNSAIGDAIAELISTIKGISQQVPVQEVSIVDAVRDTDSLYGENKDSPQEDAQIENLRQEQDAMVLWQETQRKINEQSGRERQKKDAYFRKLEIRFQKYDVAIEQLKAFQHGGPHPTCLVELQVPDAQACYYRLTQIWKDLDISEGYDVDTIRTNEDLFYKFAIGMREAHFMLHVLVYYGNNHADLHLTGWDLTHMRWLQSDMTPFAFDIPLIHSKLDVDMICSALEAVFPGQVRLERPPKTTEDTLDSNQQNQKPLNYTLFPAGNITIITQPQPAAQIQHGYNMQPAGSYPANQALATASAAAPHNAAAPVPDSSSQHLILDSASDAMEVNQICPDFAKSIYKKYNNCKLEHPESLRKTGLCRNPKVNGGCKWGGGCSFNHGVSLNAPAVLPPLQSSGNTGGVSLLALVPVGNGQTVDARLEDSYCKKWAKGQCNRNDCRRLHVHAPAGLDQQFSHQKIQAPSNVQPNFSNVNYFQGGGQGAQPVQHGAQAHTQQPKSETLCRFEATKGLCTRTSCLFLHMNPQSARFHSNAGLAQPNVSQIVQNPFGDAVMGGTTSHGDPADVTIAPPKEGKFCTNKRCEYKHSHPNSKNYGQPIYTANAEQAQPSHNGHQPSRNANRGRGGGRGGRGGIHSGGHRTPINHTFDPQQHTLHFEQPTPAQQIQVPQGILAPWLHDRAPQPSQQQPVPQAQPSHHQGQHSNNRPRDQTGRSGNARECYVCHQDSTNPNATNVTGVAHEPESHEHLQTTRNKPPAFTQTTAPRPAAPKPRLAEKPPLIRDRRVPETNSCGAATNRVIAILVTPRDVIPAPNTPISPSKQPRPAGQTGVYTGPQRNEQDSMATSHHQGPRSRVFCEVAEQAFPQPCCAPVPPVVSIARSNVQLPSQPMEGGVSERNPVLDGAIRRAGTRLPERTLGRAQRQLLLDAQLRCDAAALQRVGCSVAAGVPGGPQQPSVFNMTYTRRSRKAGDVGHR